MVRRAQTAGRTLAAGLNVVHLNRDDVIDGLRLTVARGGPTEIVQPGVPAHSGTLEHLLAAGVSLVADGTMYMGEMEQSVRRLRDFAEVVNVHCFAEEWRERFSQRQRGRGASSELMSRWHDLIQTYGRRIVDPLELSCQRIEVRTDDGYDPTIDDILGRSRHPKTAATRRAFRSEPGAPAERGNATRVCQVRSRSCRPSVRPLSRCAASPR